MLDLSARMYGSLSLIFTAVECALGVVAVFAPYAGIPAAIFTILAYFCSSKREAKKEKAFRIELERAGQINQVHEERLDALQNGEPKLWLPESSKLK